MILIKKGCWVMMRWVAVFSYVQVLRQCQRIALKELVKSVIGQNLLTLLGRTGRSKALARDG